MRRAVSGKPDVLDCAPHFERMLCDNAQLARVYLHAWQVTGNEFFRTITEEILDYVAREMTDPGVGMGHLVVRRLNHRYGTKAVPFFLVLGLVFLCLSLLLMGNLASAALDILGITTFLLKAGVFRVLASGS
jgi:hypothetical protein